jgi:hypothetical protein
MHFLGNKGNNRSITRSQAWSTELVQEEQASRKKLRLKKRKNLSKTKRSSHQACGGRRHCPGVMRRQAYECGWRMPREAESSRSGALGGGSERFIRHSELDTAPAQKCGLA